MYRLVRISLQNWYLVDALDIEIRGSAALIGPTGAGKSSIQDAIQTIIAGNNANRIHLNPSASGKSRRTVRDYCLGYVEDPSEGGKPKRSACETVIALTFEHEETARRIAIGLAMTAWANETREETISRFVADGYSYSVEDAVVEADGERRLMKWADIRSGMAAKAVSFEEFKSAERFTAGFLQIMRGRHSVPDIRHFLRAFGHALAFKPIYDPTEYVRSYVLEPEPIDVERVRMSIRNWQDLLVAIADLEARLATVERIDRKFSEWAEGHLSNVQARLAAAFAESRMAADDVRRFSADFARKSSELAAERSTLDVWKGRLRAIDHELRSLRGAAARSGEQSQLAVLEAEEAGLEREKAHIARQYHALRRSIDIVHRLAGVDHVMRSIADTIGAPLRENQQIAEALAGRVDVIDEALSAIGSRHAVDVADRIERALGDAIGRKSAIAAEIEDRRAQRDLAGQGAVSRETMRFRGDLSRSGIPSTVVADHVEVVDREWQRAVETLLGFAREAVIVAPEHVRAALDIMQQGGHGRVLLVKTDAVARGEVRRPAGSVMEAIEVSDRHAAAFLDARIGAYRKAASDDELRRMDVAVTKTGRVTSRMSYSVQRPVEALLFGASSRQQSGEENEKRLIALSDEHERLTLDLNTFRQAAIAMADLVSFLAETPTPARVIDSALQDLQVRMRSIAAMRYSVEQGDDDGIIEQIRDLERDQAGIQEDIAEDIEPKVNRLVSETAQVEARLELVRANLRKAIASKRAALKLLDREDTVRLSLARGSAGVLARQAVAGVREKIKGLDRKALADLRESEAAAAGEAQGVADRAGRSAYRDMVDYGAQWSVEFPFDRDAGFGWCYEWTVQERARLEKSDLRSYRGKVEKAEREMRRALREDLLLKLSERFQKTEMRIASLNRRLADRTFTNQTYAFEYAVDERFADVHMLVEKIARSADDAQAILENAAEDPVVKRALDAVQMLLDGTTDADVLADYRNYFVFELAMFVSDGRRTTLTSRAVRGSGGEAQAPFYIAMAASLSSAYFPGGDAMEGMSLAVFDEAFGKLDVLNTQSLVRLFGDMGLQLMLAAPEDKRATLTEVVDTIVTVIKSPDARSVFIESEFPGPLARARLHEINPDHMPV